MQKALGKENGCHLERTIKFGNSIQSPGYTGDSLRTLWEKRRDTDYLGRTIQKEEKNQREF